MADEFIYFLARRVPPAGLGNTYAQSLDLSSELSASLHVAPLAQLDAWLAAGRFATVVIDADDPKTKAFDLARLYAGRTRLDGVDIFWGRVLP